MTEQAYNPTEYTVDQVNEYLDTHPDQAETVLAAEQSRDDGTTPRVGITEGPHKAADETSEGDTPTDSSQGEHDAPNPTGTPDHVDVSANDLADANAVALTGDGETSVTDVDAAYDAGYFGTSPQREATGLDDKGLSQATVLKDQDGQVTAPPSHVERAAGSYDAVTGAFTPAPVETDDES